MRKAIIAGNWKMNKTLSESVTFVNDIKDRVAGADCDVVLCAPAISLNAMVEAAKGTNIKIGAQNMHFEESGAFTGEIAPGMLKDLGVEYVVLGHSERRQYFNETDETVNKKMHAAIKHGLVPVLCVGESLEEREGGVTEKVLSEQLKADLAGISAADLEKVVIAYEPIWAIGTGKTATSDQANETIQHVRKVVAEVSNTEVADKVRIQYGGSVKPNTIVEQMSKSDIDGALVGGASLLADDYVALVNYNK